MTMSIKNWAWIEFRFLNKWDECVNDIYYFLNLFIECRRALGYVMTDWFNIQIQAITH